MLAGEPIDVLVKALASLKWTETDAGIVRFSALLDRELGHPLQRALMRIEGELLAQDAEQVGKRDSESRTAEQRRADALVALVLRLADARATEP